MARSPTDREKFGVGRVCLMEETIGGGSRKGTRERIPPPLAYSNFLPVKIPPVTSLLNLLTGYMIVCI